MKLISDDEIRDLFEAIDHAEVYGWWIFSDGYVRCIISGEFLPLDVWLHRLEISEEEKVMLKLQYG